MTSPIEVVKVLPREHKNCGDCGDSLCMVFSSKLIAGKVALNKCPHLTPGQIVELEKLMTPPVGLIAVGNGDATVNVGGERVLHRHELRFFNPTAFAVDVEDTMNTKLLEERLEKIRKLVFYKMESRLRLDMVAVTASSKDPATFAQALTFIRRKTDLPLVLCSFDPEVMAAGLKVVGSGKPLIFAATNDNWESMTKLAKKYDAPLAISAPLTDMEALIKRINAEGVSQVVLAPDSHSLSQNLEDLTTIRRLAVTEGRYPYPSMAFSKDIPESAQESCWAAAQMLRYAGIVVLQSIEPAQLVHILTLRQDIFTDPTMPAVVEPGLYNIGQPNEKSPVLITSNFSMTYSVVSGDIRAGNLDCYLLVADTGGYSVLVSVVMRRITGEIVHKLIEESEVMDKVGHRNLIIPGLMLPLKEEVEEATGMDVLLGPSESSGIPDYIRDHWKSSR